MGNLRDDFGVGLVDDDGLVLGLLGLEEGPERPARSAKKYLRGRSRVPRFSRIERESQESRETDEEDEAKSPRHHTATAVPATQRYIRGIFRRDAGAARDARDGLFERLHLGRLEVGALRLPTRKRHTRPQASRKWLSWSRLRSLRPAWTSLPKTNKNTRVRVVWALLLETSVGPLSIS